MIDLKHRRSIPIDGCSDEILKKLDLLFPVTGKDFSKVSSSSAPIPHEETGPIIIGDSRGSDRLALGLANELKVLAAQHRPNLESHLASLRPYYLWRTFRFSCKHIEALHPHPRSNLPATILELIERFGLPYDLNQYQDLQRMALVQFYTNRKVYSLEDAFRGSRIQDLSLTDLHEKVTGLMTVIRGKIAAEGWANAAPERKQARVSRKLKRDLLLFAMWHVSQISVDNISRLLLESKSRVAKSILDEVLRLKAPLHISKTDLKNLAQFTNDPPLYITDVERYFVNGPRG
jgi:hypothetical protein